MNEKEGMDGDVVREFSSKFGLLDVGAKKWYAEKLDLIVKEVKDPYCVSVKIGEKFVLVEFGDLYTYFIMAPSPVTKDELKVWKSIGR